MTEANIRPVDRPRFPVGILILSAIAATPGILILVQRNLVYGDCSRYGMFSGDMVPLSIWGIAGLLLLLVAKPWKPRRSLARVFLACGALGAVTAVGLLVLFSAALGRYWVLKFETQVRCLTISAHDEPTRRSLDLELVDPDVGPYLTRDVALLQRVVEVGGPGLATDPRAARVIYAALRHHGLTFDAILKMPNGKHLAFATLLGESDPQPWHELEWLSRPELDPQPGLGFHAGLLPLVDARRVVNARLADLDQADLVATEQWLYATMNYPTLFTADERGRIFDRWPVSFTDLQSLAFEGLLVRDAVCDMLGETTALTVHVAIEGSPPNEYRYRELPESLPRMLTGLVQSCGVVATPAEAEADLVLRVQLDQIAHHEYTRPTYTTETYYKQRMIYNRYRPTISSRRVRKTRTVQTGRETLAAYAPVALASVDYGDAHLEWPEGLLLWHHMRYDEKAERFTTPEDEAVWGRVWPLGLHERHFIYAYMQESY